MNTTPAILPALPAELPPVPEGYIYVGFGPLIALTPDACLSETPQPAGDLCALSGFTHSSRPLNEWRTEERLTGMYDLHYLVRVGSPAHYKLFPAGDPLPPVPDGYDYVGKGPLFERRDGGRMLFDHPTGHLAAIAYQEDGWDVGWPLNGMSPNMHYAAKRGTEAHQQLLPHLQPEPCTPEPCTLEQEPFTPTPETTMDTDTEEELPTFHIRLEDGRIVPDDCLVEVVISGHCENHSSSGHRYYGQSSDFETTMLPEDDEGVTWLENENCFALAGSCDTLRVTESGDKAFESNCTRIHGDWYHNDMVSYDGHGDPFYSEDDDYVYCEGAGENYHRNECHYCEHEGEWVYGEADDCACSNTEGSDDRINEYHHSPTPEHYHGACRSRWGIGFEVEKTDIYGVEDEGQYVGSSPLFAGWERDASCGVEGITHVYDPLSADDIFRDHVERSRRYLNAASDKTCGGHINISNIGLTPRSLLQRLRTYAPLWYAIYRDRLNNSYCIEDKKVEHGTVKYSPLRTKDFGVELRLPSGVRNAEQLVRRFELMARVCRAIDAGWSLNHYAKECRQLLLHGAYGGNRTKYAQILRLMRHFDRWFKDGHIHADIAQYV
jgi:hypothetical protein